MSVARRESPDKGSFACSFGITVHRTLLPTINNVAVRRTSLTVTNNVADFENNLQLYTCF